MLTILALPLLLLAPATPTAADLAAEGDAYLKAAETADHPLDVLVDAHASFDSAYLVGHDAHHLCRALDVAELALQSETFAGDEERQSWEETREEDLDRLRQDAATTGRGNCRFAGKPAAPRVSMIDPDGALPRMPEPAAQVEDSAAPPGPVGRGDVRRWRAHTAAGTVLTTAGLGLLGVLTGVLVLERRWIGEMRGIVGTAQAEGRLFTVDEHRRFGELRDDVFRGADVAIGVGVAGLATLGTGVALLATRKKARARGYSFQPYGGPLGAGAVLRLKF
ncbi:MAG: hypothetical protein JNL82_08475 [Myxococcales bacterium]|nr:hypothetical protein [Myxococcales bacterium]